MSPVELGGQARRECERGCFSPPASDSGACDHCWHRITFAASQERLDFEQHVQKHNLGRGYQDSPTRQTISPVDSEYRRRQRYDKLAFAEYQATNQSPEDYRIISLADLGHTLPGGELERHPQDRIDRREETEKVCHCENCMSETVRTHTTRLVVTRPLSPNEPTSYGSPFSVRPEQERKEELEHMIRMEHQKQLEEEMEEREHENRLGAFASRTSLSQS
jgi:hypothetical protein